MYEMSFWGKKKKPTRKVGKGSELQEAMLWPQGHLSARPPASPAQQPEAEWGLRSHGQAEERGNVRVPASGAHPIGTGSLVSARRGPRVGPAVSSHSLAAGGKLREHVSASLVKLWARGQRFVVGWRGSVAPAVWSLPCHSSSPICFLTSVKQSAHTVLKGLRRLTAST